MSSETNIGVTPGWPPAPKNWQLAENEVHVWTVSLDQTPAQVSGLAAPLSPDEQTRVGRFHFERDRNRFVVGRGTLRLLLGQYLRLPPGEIKFEYTARGKPLLSRTNGLDTLHFNLAHSGALALLAVTRVAEVGVDIEQIRPLRDADGIAQRFFSSQESGVLRALAPLEMQNAFYNLWTRKEAWLKATGEGIGESLNQVEVSCLPQEPCRFMRLFGDSFAASQWRLLHLTPADGYVGALAMRDSDAEVKCWRLNC